ncbi:MAG: amidophosphoribosyltransferase [Candidatus Levybacteria bacterium]|nr:amidophosphoribosyltransferase [Candidatus Levybacteria bacterium]MDZ4227813.1 amidophosphoribosyltransferase [Candidatus Levybacteria bacterium]
MANLERSPYRPEIKEIQEECAVVGAYSTISKPVAAIVLEGLIELNHRGQESAGIVVAGKNGFQVVKDAGLAEIVFKIKHDLPDAPDASVAIGHDRYSTSGGKKDMQPFSDGNIAFAHNGNLTNIRQLKDRFNLPDEIDGAKSDSRMALAVINSMQGTEKERILQALPLFKGSYCFVFGTKDALYASRDPKGFKPLVIGKIRDDGYVVASETAALRSMGANFLREVKAGETIQIDKDGLKTIALTSENEKLSKCIFELIYFSRPDSVVFGIPVMEFRRKQGGILARHLPDVDVISSVPRSGDGATLGVAASEIVKISEKTLVSAFYPNPYRNIAKSGPRTFILPGGRDKAATQKYSVMESSVKGKRIALVDDSIVRGSMKRIVQILRFHGASEVHALIASPPLMHSCYFGADFSDEELLAHEIPDIEERREYLGLDSLYHLSYAELLEAAIGNPVENVAEVFGENGFCGACFTGKYPTLTGGEISKKETVLIG